jgi:RNA polymerase sigma factor (TIGR02999 family)
MDDHVPVTDLLARWNDGDVSARDELFARMYQELREIAEWQRRRWGGNHTMNTTALVHELYEKLAGQAEVDIEDRTHFNRLAGRAMRHILVDYAKKKSRKKRASDNEKVSLDDADTGLLSTNQLDLILDVNQALYMLESLDDRMTRVVEMHFFAGLTYQEIGDALGISKRSVSRDWTKARALLRRQFREASDAKQPPGA